MRRPLIGAGVAGALAVALGAFGAHALEGRLAPERRATWDTAVLWHAVHAVALLATAALPTTRAVAVARWTFAIGILLFSGSLYVLAATGARWLGAVTPVGGVAFLVGWVALAVAGWRGGSPGA